MKRHSFKSFFLSLILPCIFLCIQGNNLVYRAFEIAKFVKKFTRKKSVFVKTSPDKHKRFYHQSTTLPFSQTSTTDIFFSQKDDIAKHLISLINQETESIKIAAFIFTNNNIAKSLINALKRGVRVEIIVDKTFLKEYGSTINYLKDHGADILVYNSYGIMHHKIMLFHGLKKAGSGSYNFTHSANNINCENFTITDYEEITEQLLAEFERIKKLLIFP